MVKRAPLSIDGRSLNLKTFAGVTRNRPFQRVTLSAATQRRMARSARFVRDLLETDSAVYGINTGFGRLADISISARDRHELQRNLLVSHAAGVGSPCSTEEVRGMMLLRLNCLATGLSGVRPELAATLAVMLNSGIHPVIPRRGSVGASGDLAPMSYLGLAAIGEGEVEFEGRRIYAKRAWKQIKRKPITLEEKEGLAFINGVQASTALLALAILDIESLAAIADQACALSALAIGARSDAFDPRISSARPHPGQTHAARRILQLLRTTGRSSSDLRVQDPYSIRCAAQVHGVAYDALSIAKQTAVIEMNSATDNPLVFADQSTVISGGNFHGAPIGHCADHLASVIADVAAIGERRIALLMDPQFNCATPFLAMPDGEGLHSGLMMWQVTAASQVSEMKTLAHPASVDTIPTSLGQEDHVSMSMWAADKLRQSVERWRVVLAIELLSAWRSLALAGTLPTRGPLARICAQIGTVHGHGFEDRRLDSAIDTLASSLATSIP